MFDHIVNWKLKAGSHDFPGPEGGTCINEAAIVAAGFEYKKINSAYDCPPCFSRPIAAYAIGLNDRMDDDLRQELLMPFVTRLAGTADDATVELARAHHMAIQTTKRITPLWLARRHPDLAAKCRLVSTLREARLVAFEVKQRTADYAYADAAYAYTFVYAYTFAYAAYAAAAYAAAAAAYAKRQVWLVAVEILDEAIRMGRNQDLEIEQAAQRLNETMASARKELV